MEPVGLKKYLLIRIGLDVAEETWFGTWLGMPEVSGTGENPEKISSEDGKGEEAGGVSAAFRVKRRRILSWLSGKGRRGAKNVTGEEDAEIREQQKERRERNSRRAKRQERKFRREAKRESEALRQEREERLYRTETAIGRLAGEVQELAGADSDLFCVYEDGIGRVLNGRTALAGLWQKWFEWKTFDRYTDVFWVELLMDAAVWPQFVILGTADCVPGIIEAHASRMKSLRWLIPEADCTEEVQQFVEDFYVESGLAITLQTVPEVREFRRMQLISVQPTNILDFTGETHVLVSRLAAGSVWIDMRSLEEKKRRILGRGDGIVYVSLKEKWKSAQRRCKSPVLS